MYFVSNLPTILTLVIASVISLLGLQYGEGIKELSIKLIFSIPLFYLAGMVIRGIIRYFIRKSLTEKISKKIYNQTMNAVNAENSKTQEKSDEEFEPYSPKRYKTQRVEDETAE